ncbi:MAG: 50S ribosomal protein L10 [Oscillospiraceae bacterium]|nr:50S ribosomal protein L10 [Oscillospiraceae bacterium]
MPSEAKLQSNKETAAKIAEELKASQGTVLVDYRGINVSQDTELRAALRKAGVKYSVVKNSMTRFAVRELGLDELEKSLIGPTAIATSTTDPVAPAKVMSDFAKRIDSLEIKAGVVGTNVIDLAGVLALAELPPKEILVSKMLGMMAVPISGLVNVLNANIRGLAVALSAVVEKRQEQEQQSA